MKKTYWVIAFIILIPVILGYFAWSKFNLQGGAQFDGERAYEDVKQQISFGPRTTGSESQEKFLVWLGDSLEQAGWSPSFQQSEMMGHTIKNVFAHRGDAEPQILLLAHYDSRLVADNDPDRNNHLLPVPGANDGASGVAILLELSKVIPEDSIPIGLVFFDAEDNGRIPGWDWILGSRAFVANLKYKPRAVVLVDMVGDSNLDIYMEMNSDPELNRQIWEVARALGYEKSFIPEYKHRIIDDHVPFIEAGIPAIDIIDIDYPYWHTTLDTVDKVSPESLNQVGNTLLQWILAQEQEIDLK
jgi:glutaminyl-peptide cyclotransferase